ncbi:MAG: Hsp20/alpha crystallin family protein [Candidatus Koribacter versatilis]|uniref:Hsp20/alpha crystallin family protein n=1 Tax=Candidatus Korobacter versatilis TaxID=658062 RepID=A0A932EQ02_9BACT|nr:Hsp20/alpha crystallin family protein [Candidatus Koribacter versatilis]
MTMITRWDPFRDMATLNSRLNQIFADYGRGNDELTSTGFVPPVDIYEDEHNVTLKVEVPGMAEKDLDIRVENNTLTVRGERRFEQEQKEENFHRIERRYGSFARSFTLPSTVDSENVQAHYVNGVLEIELAKKAEAKPKQIKVNIGQPSQGQKTIEGKSAKSAA